MPDTRDDEDEGTEFDNWFWSQEPNKPIDRRDAFNAGLAAGRAQERKRIEDSPQVKVERRGDCYRVVTPDIVSFKAWPKEWSKESFWARIVPLDTEDTNG